MSAPDGILFDGSYVLGVVIAPYTLSLEMDFLLKESSSLYEKPPAGERGSFRRGYLLVEQFSTLNWDATGAPPAYDASGELDYGCLDEYHEIENGFEFSGDWGTIRVIGGALSVKFSDNKGGGGN